MNKVKKIATGIGVFFSSLITKVYAIDPRALEPISMYAVDPGPETRVRTIWDSISKIGKIAIPVVLFVIGLFVILSKKITKKVKVIVISVLVILAILGYVIMNKLPLIFN